MKEITLTQGKVATVDDEDYDELNNVKWYAVRGRGGLYAIRKTTHDDGKQHKVWMHREIAKTPTGMETDHINGNTLDNRRLNLRICTHSQNLINQKRASAFSSQYKGVTWDKNAKKWMAQLRFNKVRYYFGIFDSEIEAAKVRDERAREICGEFAILNFKNESDKDE